MRIFGSTFASVLALFGFTTAIPTLSITGSKFFDSDGTQFYIKGVAYQLTEDDPLVNTTQCQLDASLMKQLGANSIRVYHVDASADHSGCMSAFADAGIYAWIDLDSFKTYVRFDNISSWTSEKQDSYQAVMDTFQQYDNTAGFFVGNEVLNTLLDSSAAPFLLTATVDLRAYGKSKGYRPIPIGYSATDTDALPMLADYLVCRSNATERVDFYALNSYRWCGPSSFTDSSYNTLLQSFEDYPVPVFFSEDGCNTVPPRTFDDQAAVFGQMANVWSGAIIYEWIEEMNNYGLIEYGPSTAASVNEGSSIVQGFVRQGSPTPISPDFTNLQDRWATLTPSGVDSSGYAATVKTTAPSCPAYTSGATAWTVDPTAPLPTLGEAVVSGMTTGVPNTISSSGTAVQTSESSSTSATNGTSTSHPFIVSTPNLPLPGQSSTASSAASSASGSSSSQGAATRAASTPIILDSFTCLRSMVGLAGICLGAMIWL